MTEPWRAIPVVDADGHITESTEQLRPYFEGRQGERGHWAGRRSYYPEDGWDRSLGGRLGRKEDGTPNTPGHTEPARPRIEEETLGSTRPPQHRAQERRPPEPR